MSEMNGMPGIPDGPPPGAPGSPQAPITPPPAPPAMPDFGPSTAPAAKPMNGIGAAALVIWILGGIVFLIVAGFIITQVVKGFSDGPFGNFGGGDTCTFTQDPSPEEAQACLDSGDMDSQWPE